MFYSSLKPIRKTGLFFLAGAILMISLLAQPARAQSGGIDPDPGDRGTGGKNMVQGTIYLPGGRRLDRRVKVKLRGTFTSEQFQFSDENGAFIFRRLAGGTYTLTVDAGPDFEVTSEIVDIVEPPRRRNEPGITVPVFVTLQPKYKASAGPAATVDASTGVAPEQARELYKKAIESARVGDRKKAIEQLNQAVSIYPNFMTALNELGVQYIALGQFDKAIEALRGALKIAPEAFYPRLNYGIALVQTKKYKEAAQELQQAVEKDSSSAVAHLYLGRTLVNLGSYGSAEAALQRAISIGGDDVIEAHRYLGIVYIEKQNNKSAADELELYLKLAPQSKDAEKIKQIIKQLRGQASANR